MPLRRSLLDPHHGGGGWRIARPRCVRSGYRGLCVQVLNGESLSCEWCGVVDERRCRRRAGSSRSRCIGLRALVMLSNAAAMSEGRSEAQRCRRCEQSSFDVGLVRSRVLLLAGAIVDRGFCAGI